MPPSRRGRRASGVGREVSPSYQTWSLAALRDELARRGTPAPSWRKKSGLVRLLTLQDADSPSPAPRAPTTTRRAARVSAAATGGPPVHLPVHVHARDFSHIGPGNHDVPPLSTEVVAVLQQLRGAVTQLEARCDATTEAVTRLAASQNTARTESDARDPLPEPGPSAGIRPPQRQPTSAGDSTTSGDVLAAGNDVTRNSLPAPGNLNLTSNAPPLSSTADYGQFSAPPAVQAWALGGSDYRYPGQGVSHSLGGPQPAANTAHVGCSAGAPHSGFPGFPLHNAPNAGFYGQGFPLAGVLGGPAGVRSDCAPQVEIVSEQLRRDVVQGKDVNLAAFLIPGYKSENEAGIRSVLANGEAIPLKPLSDPRLNRALTIQEFIEAFSIYKNIMTGAYPNRRSELDLYERDIVNMSARFGGLAFYEYHKAFSARAAALLSQLGIKVDWSLRDQNLFNQVFAGHKIHACEICNSSGHDTSFCPQALGSTGAKGQSTIPTLNSAPSPNRKRQANKPALTGAGAAGHVDRLGRPRIQLELCNNFNESTCSRTVCHLLHYCSFCWLPGHPSRLCGQKGAVLSPPNNATSHHPRPAASATVSKFEPTAPVAPAPRKAAKWLSRSGSSLPPSPPIATYANYSPPPIKVAQLEAELSYADSGVREPLISGLKSGFHIGISHFPSLSLECRNLLSARSDPSTVTSLLQEELGNGYLIGPYNSPPFATFRINPLGLAQRKFSNKKRLTVDMSAPHNSQDHCSLNDSINKADFSLHYVKLDDAISIINSLGPGVLMCKADIKDAFKQVPVHSSIWPFQGIRWQGLYYFFTRLVFGCRSSPKIFDSLSSALNWIAINNYNLPYTLHLLDDFLSIIPHHMDGVAAMARLRSMFQASHIPLSEKKTVGPASSLEYLGIVLDSIAMEARLPPDKLIRITAFVQQFLGLSKCTQRELLSLIGHLGFATRVIPAGRTFMSRLFTAAYSVRQLQHRVYLNSECRKDLLMWHQLLKGWNGISLFLEREPTSAESLDLYTDASWALGFGGYFQGKWFYGEWPPEVASSSTDPISIAFHEPYRCGRHTLEQTLDSSAADLSFRQSGHLPHFEQGSLQMPPNYAPHATPCAPSHPCQFRLLCCPYPRPFEHPGWLSLTLADPKVPEAGPTRRPSTLPNPLQCDAGLTLAAIHYQHAALSRSTRSAYHSGTNAFMSFMAMHGHTSPHHLPAIDEAILILFVTHCAMNLRLAHTTIKTYLCGVRNLYIEANHSNPLVTVHGQALGKTHFGPTGD